MQHIRAICTDYDETIAEHGFVPQLTLAAMERFRSSGRMLILNTGRGLDDLRSVFPELHRFDRVVVENGAVLFHPATGEERLLAQPLPASFFQELHRRGVSPLPKRRVILDTAAMYRTRIEDAIEQAGLSLHLIFNKESVLVLPRGVDKGTGLRAALEDTEISLPHVAGIGDAQNDHELLAASGVAVAVPNAIPEILARAHHVLTFPQLVDAILIQ